MTEPTTTWQAPEPEAGPAPGLEFASPGARLVGYFPYFWSRSGQTPGMKLMGIKVVRDADGGPISVGQAILRLIGYWVSGAVFYIGYIWIFIDKRKRGWMDLIAGTVVVSAPNDLTS